MEGHCDSTKTTQHLIIIISCFVSTDWACFLWQSSWASDWALECRDCPEHHQWCICGSRVDQIHVPLHPSHEEPKTLWSGSSLCWQYHIVTTTTFITIKLPPLSSPPNYLTFITTKLPPPSSPPRYPHLHHHQTTSTFISDKVPPPSSLPSSPPHHWCVVKSCYNLFCHKHFCYLSYHYHPLHKLTQHIY